MRIGIVQSSPVIGGIEENLQIIQFYLHHAQRYDLSALFFSELFLCGYHPGDLLFYSDFQDRQNRCLDLINESLAQWESKEFYLGFGYAAPNDKEGLPYLNRYIIFNTQNAPLMQDKTYLPNYDVYQEKRYFHSSQERKIFSFLNKQWSISICEDIWYGEPIEEYKRKTIYPKSLGASYLEQVDYLLVPSASLFYPSKLEQRLKLCLNFACQGFYINTVAAYEENIFDGASFYFDGQEKKYSLAPQFTQGVLIYDTDNDLHKKTKFISEIDLKQKNIQKSCPIPFHSLPFSPKEFWFEVEEAIIFGLREFFDRIGFTKAHFGLSGGLDSSVIACLIAKALGSQNVHAFILPGPFTQELSIKEAHNLVHCLGIHSSVISINSIYQDCLHSLDCDWNDGKFSLMEENIQARIRAMFLMAYSNKQNSCLITTSNKSEIATGYSTLYGDMAGSICPIGDLFKSEVYELAHYINQDYNRNYGYQPISSAVLNRPPSAELRDNQEDVHSLGDYATLDRILHYYLIDFLSESSIVAKGFDAQYVKETLNKVKYSEYKRKQAPPIIRLSKKAFGSGRKIPLIQT